MVSHLRSTGAPGRGRPDRERLAGIATIYLFGYTWLAFWIGDAGAAITAGVAPFMTPDLLKLAGAVSIFYLWYRTTNRRKDA
ncbi:biotin transporter BioY [bacterium]|nr:biotin transporter BioY [bacterium]